MSGIIAVLRRLLQRIWRSQFARNVAVVATGTAGAQVIGVAFAPIITRLYGPEAFGVLGTFSAALMVLAPLAAMCYPIAIVLPREDASAVGIAKLSLIVATLMAALVTLVLMAFGEPIIRALQLEAISSFIMLLPVAMFLSACLAVITQWAIRKKLYRITARVAVLQAVLVNGAKAGMGLLNPAGLVLVVISVLGNLISTVMLIFGVRAANDGRPLPSTSHVRPALSELAYRHRDFPCFRAPQAILNAASRSLPVLMLAAFFGPASAGFYALGLTVLGVPSRLIGGSVRDVFYPRITEAAHNGENMTGLIVKATLGLAVVGLLPYGVVVVFGPQLFAIVFGVEWVFAGEYARWLALFLFAGFLTNPSLAAIPPMGKQGYLLIFEVISLIARAGALYYGFAVIGDDLFAVMLVSLAGLVMKVVLIASTVKFSRQVSAVPR